MPPAVVRAIQSLGLHGGVDDDPRVVDAEGARPRTSAAGTRGPRTSRRCPSPVARARRILRPASNALAARPGWRRPDRAGCSRRLARVVAVSPPAPAGPNARASASRVAGPAIPAAPSRQRRMRPDTRGTRCDRRKPAAAHAHIVVGERDERRAGRGDGRRCGHATTPCLRFEEIADARVARRGAIDDGRAWRRKSCCPRQSARTAA